MLRNEGYLRVKEPATLLGVAPNTLRAWGAAGKIPEYRNPVNNYRLYRQEDLEELLQQIQQPVNQRTLGEPRQGTR